MRKWATEAVSGGAARGHAWVKGPAKHTSLPITKDGSGDHADLVNEQTERCARLWWDSRVGSAENGRRFGGPSATSSADYAGPLNA